MRPAAVLARLGDLLARIEDYLLVTLLVLMLAMAALQIVLRNLFGGGLLWGDLAVRIGVLWLGLLGAMTASRSGEHIRIDVVARHVSERARRVLRVVTDTFAAGVCLLVAVYAARFVLDEARFGAMAFARVPVWLCAAIIPAAFGIMALRYACSGGLGVAALMRDAR